MTNKENIINLITKIKSLVYIIVSNAKSCYNDLISCIGTTKSNFSTCITNVSTCADSMYSYVSSLINATRYTSIEKDTNGYIVLSNGFTIQWGIAEYDSSVTGGGAVVTFPKRFSTACLNVITGPGSTNDYSTWNCDYSPIKLTRYGFIIYLAGNYTKSGSSIKSEYFPVYWQAIGY